METQTIKRVSYLDKLKETFHDDTHPDEWFQQDGATAHTATEVTKWLREDSLEGLFPTVRRFSVLVDVPISLALIFLMWICQGESILALAQQTFVS